jgi:hypothetical protein
MADATVRWVATLSNGDTIAEQSGEWVEIPGQRKPWVRLTQFAAKNGYYLTSLRLNVDGRTIHMPRANFDRFAMNETSLAPLFYSLQYHMEADGLFGSGDEKQSKFIDLAAHYPEGIAVHYIQELGEQSNSWVLLTKDAQRMAPTPLKK